MSPTPQEYAWTYEILVHDTAYGDYHYEGRYLETILKTVSDFLRHEFNCFVSLDDFCSCLGCRTVYIGGFIRRYSANETSSILLCLGSKCHYGAHHTEDPDSRALAESITHHIQAVFVEQGFCPEVECVPVVNAFQSA